MKILLKDRTRKIKKKVLFDNNYVFSAKNYVIFDNNRRGKNSECKYTHHYQIID